MEALRKAEEAKRRMQQQEQLAAPGADNRGALEPSSARTAAGGPATTKAPGLALEEREPSVTPTYIIENFTTEQGADNAQAQELENQREPPADQDERTDAQQEPYYPQADAYQSPVAERISPRTLARKQKTAAASVFAAKQHPARNRKTMTILVVVMALILPIGGGTLWYLQTMAPPSIGINPTVANYDLASRGFIGEETAAAPPATTPTPQGTAPAPEAAIAQETASAAPVATATVSGTPGAESTDESIAEPPVEAAPVVVAAAVPQPAPLIPSGTGAPEPEVPATLEPAQVGVLEVSRSEGTRTVNPDLVTAYNRVQSGDLLVAGQLYQEVLTSLPNNRDALLGLALVRLRQEQLPEARELYARLLQLNPRDPLAHAGLLQSMQVIDPAEQESTLKALLDQYPEVAPLEMALGNLYASQQRWSEAQGAYYNALLTASRSTGGPVHPDYAFNLAVSLEQLNQKKAALDYYRQAQTLAREVTPGFDPQLLNSRLAYLEQNQP